MTPSRVRSHRPRRRRRRVRPGLAAGAVLALLVGGCTPYVARPLSPAGRAAALEARSLADPGLARFVTARGTRPGPWPPERWTPDDLTWVALYFAPELEAARARLQTARGARETARRRPNPVLRVAPELVSNPAAGATPWIAALQLDWPLETAGKRRRRMERAAAQERSARLGLLSNAWEVHARVREAWLAWAAAAGRAERLGRRVALEEDVAALLARRVEAGEVALAVAERARAGALRTRSDRSEAVRLAAAAQSRLAHALALPRAALDGLRPDLDALAPDVAPAELAAARRAALTSRPDVLAALADYAAAEADLRLEIARQWPDVHLGPGYQFDQGANKWSLGLSVELPLLDRNQGPIAEAEARRRGAAAAFDAVQAAVLAGIDAAEADRRAAAEGLAQAQGLFEARSAQVRRLRRRVEEGEAGRLDLRSAELEQADAALLRFEARVAERTAALRLRDALRRPTPALAAELAADPVPAGAPPPGSLP